VWDSRAMNEKRIRQGESMRVPVTAGGIVDDVALNTGWDKTVCIGVLCELGAFALDFPACDAVRKSQLVALYRASKAAHRAVKLKTKLADTLGTPPTRYQRLQPRVEIDPDSAAAKELL